MLNITKNIDDGVLTISLEGRLDAVSSRDFEEELQKVLESISALTIDCAKLSYISSAGLRVILEAQQYLEENDREDVKVINANEVMTGIFEETGFANIINLVR